MQARISTSASSADEVLDLLFQVGGRNGSPPVVDFRELVSWISKGERATHFIHAYPAKLLRQIPAVFCAAKQLSDPGDVVMDPFAGSGTVLLEAQLAGRRAVGVDSNPLACLISRVKTTPLDPRHLQLAAKRLRQRVDRLSDERGLPDVVNLSYWFTPRTTEQLKRLKSGIDRFQNPAIRDFFLLCLSQTSRKVSLADPRLNVPVRLQRDQYPVGHPLRETSNRGLKMLTKADVPGLFNEAVVANLRRMEGLTKAGAKGFVDVVEGDSRFLRKATSHLGLEGRVKLALTSPPYVGAQKYVRSSSLSLGWLSLASSKELRLLEELSIGREHFRKHQYESFQPTGIEDADKLLTRIRRLNPLRAHIAATYLVEMRLAFEETIRMLTPNGFLVIVGGTNSVCGHTFETWRYLEWLVTDLGMKREFAVSDIIKSRGLMTKRNRSAEIIPAEVIMGFRKASARFAVK